MCYIDREEASEACVMKVFVEDVCVCVCMTKGVMECVACKHESMQARNFANTSLVDGTYLLFLSG